MFHYSIDCIEIEGWPDLKSNKNMSIPMYQYLQWSSQKEKNHPKQKKCFYAPKPQLSQQFFLTISLQNIIYKQYFEISECRLGFKALVHKIGLPVLLRPLYVESFVETWGGQVSKSRGAITRKLWPEIETISRKMGILWHGVAEVGSLSASAKMLTFFLYLLFSRQRRRFCA